MNMQRGTPNIVNNLQSLSRPAVSRPASQAIGLYSDKFTAQSELPDQIFKITSYEDEPSPSQVHYVSARGLVQQKTLPPYPPYDSCIPISRKYHEGPGGTTLIICPSSHSLAILRMITPTTMTTTTISRGTNQIRILIDAQADSETWRPDDQLKQPLLLVASYATRPNETVKYFLERSCNNLNCVTGFCTTHLKTQSPNPAAPKLPYYRLSDSIDASCGKHWRKTMRFGNKGSRRKEWRMTK
ncbi:hypothetical protein BDZ97DRAFT_1431044 [Flammula alnicola]|nr:hypothetical protein BDZ97DRAFT_1431044 [Flammula alnicola]